MVHRSSLALCAVHEAMAVGKMRRRRKKKKSFKHTPTLTETIHST